MPRAIRPILDPVQIAMEALAGNNSPRSHSPRRFERDDPTPNALSIEAEDIELGFVPPPPLLSPPGRPLPEELRIIMEHPISDEEIDKYAYEDSTGDIVRPIGMYYTECEVEKYRLVKYRWRNKMLQGPKGCRRVGVFRSSQRQASLGETRRLEFRMGISRTQHVAQRHGRRLGMEMGTT